MTATIAPKLSTNVAKRDAELARRFAAVGLVLHSVESGKQSQGPTRYRLNFTDEARERPEIMRADRGEHWRYHTLYADGVDMLDDMTGDVTMLRYMAWLCRMRAYDKPLDRAFGKSRPADRWGHTYAPAAPADVLTEAEKAYQRSALALARFELGMPQNGDDLAKLRQNLADVRATLAEAIDRVKRRNAAAEKIHPRAADPNPYDAKRDYNRDADYRAAGERKYAIERAQH